jgi:tetratricopeptide (TPR) repeat protein
MATSMELYNEAEKLKDEGKHEEAIAKLQELLAADDSHVLSHLALGVLYHNVDKPEQAVEHAEKAVELEPNDPINYTALSFAYRRAFEATQDASYIQKAEDAMMRSHTMHQ